MQLDTYGDAQPATMEEVAKIDEVVEELVDVMARHGQDFYGHAGDVAAQLFDDGSPVRDKLRRMVVEYMYIEEQLGA